MNVVHDKDTSQRWISRKFLKIRPPQYEASSGLTNHNICNSCYKCLDCLYTWLIDLFAVDDGRENVNMLPLYFCKM